MSQGSNRLHFYGIPLVQGSVQNPWRIYALNFDIFELCMSDEQILGRERHRTYLDICPGKFVNKAWFSNIGKTEEKYRREVGVDRGESPDMFSNLFQVDQTWSDSFDCRAHSSEAGNFELFAPVKGVGKFD